MIDATKVISYRSALWLAPALPLMPVQLLGQELPLMPLLQLALELLPKPVQLLGPGQLLKPLRAQPLEQPSRLYSPSR
jgi:hypothetical protein